MSKFKKLLSVMVLAVVAVSCFVAHGISFASASTTSTLNDNLVYQLDFADSTNRMDNKAGNSVADAIFTTDGTNATFTEDAINGMTALNLKSNGYRKNFVEVPGEVVNYDSVTIAGWVKQSSSMLRWTRPFSVYTDNSNRMEIMPWAQNRLLNVSLVVNGTQIQDKGDGNLCSNRTDATAGTGTKKIPVRGDASSIYDVWAHYAYEFTPTDFYYYVNGALYFTVNVNDIIDNKGPNNSLSLKQIYKEGVTKLGIGATWADNTNDYTGSFADFRVYNKALSSSELMEVSGLNNLNNALVASYDFTDGVKDSIDGHDATLVNTAKVENGTLVLDGAGMGASASQLFVPSNTLMAHKEFTISVDAIVPDTTANYSRIFSFTPNWKQEIACAVKWNHDLNGTAELKGKMVTKHDVTGTNTATTTVNASAKFNPYYNEWSTIVITMDDGNLNTYINGLLVSTAYIDGGYRTDLFSMYDDGSNPFMLSFGGSPKQGQDAGSTMTMDNIKIYNKALSADEIASEYAQKSTTASELWLDAVLADVSLENGGYLESLAEANIDYMMSLNPDQILYHHRRKAGLDTKGATSLGGWEAPNLGLSGQFGSNYTAALARASANFPNYEYNGETVLERLTYLVTEFKKCQDAYAVLYPEDAGYFSGLHMDHHRIIVTRNPDTGGWLGWDHKFTVTLPDGTTQDTKIWVPWRVYHDNIKALYDIAVYAGTPELRAIGKQMMYASADWVYNELMSYTDAQRERVDNLEYGGMAEALWNIAYLAEKDGLYEKVGHYAVAAHWFEENKYLDAWFKNIDNISDKNNGHNNLDGAHANTTIPKMFALVSAYEVTNNPYYLTAAKNAFDLVVGENPDLSAGLCYAFGGQSLYENWQDPQGELNTGPHSAETCCTLNMLKFADYLFRWTGDVKYAEFYELAFTNHTLASMDPETAGKTYFVNTDFGGHKLFHGTSDSFWCCTATGLESFAKLQYGIYYKNTAGDISVNTFYPSTYKVSNGLTLVQSGNFYETQNTKITISGSGDFALRLRVPAWAKDGYTIKINGTEQNLTAQNGYIVIDRVWNDGDYVDYNVPFSIWFKTLNTTTNEKAMMYGPLTMVCKMAAVSESECIKDGSWVYQNYPTPNSGNIVKEIKYLGNFVNNANITADTTDGYPVITVKTQNQGNLTFVPFNRIFRYRYGMYFNYTEVVDFSRLNDKVEEAELLDTSMYVSTTAQAFTTALNNAKNVASTATQAEVDKAISDLDTAIANLVLKGDKTALNAKILEAETLTETDYTTSTWANLQTALTIAKAVGDDVSQETINTALNALNVAISNLVEVDDGGDTPGGDNTGDGGNTDTPGGDNTGDNGNTDNNNSGGGMSCSMSLGAETFVIGFMALAVGLFLVIKKIKRHNA